MSGPAPLRALFVQSQTETGGAESALLTALGAVDRSRLAPAVAVLGFGRGDFPDRLNRAGIKVFELKSGRLRNPFGWLRTVRKLARIARRGGFGALVANGYHPHLYSHPAARRARACSLVFCHDFPCARGRAPLIERISFALKADGYLVPSRAMAEAMRGRTGGRAPLHLVPNGVNLEAFGAEPSAGAEVRAELGLSAENIVVTVAGRLHPGKGQHIFLEATARVASEVPEARFLVVGAALFGMHEDYPDRLRAQVVRLGISDKVIFTGNRADMPVLYAASDIVVQSSLEPESFGMVVAEAMAAGRPVVVARAGGAAEVFEEGASGLGFEPGNVGELTSRILALCRDGELRRRLGEAGRERIAEHYSAAGSSRALADALGAPGRASLSPKPEETAGNLNQERTVPGQSDPGIVDLQAARYRFAAGKLSAGATVLDLACGVGSGSQLLAEEGVRVVGVDYDLPALRFAVRGYGSGVLGYSAAHALSLPFREASFDAVVCFELVEHLHEQDALLREIRRVLRLDGFLLLSTPNLLTETSLDVSGGPGVSPYHVSTLTPAALRRLLRRHFGSVLMQGYRRRGGSALYRLLRALDVFNLRLRLRWRTREALALRLGGPTQAVPAGQDPVDFELKSSGLRQATDLIAVCRGPRPLRPPAQLTLVSAAYPPVGGGVADHTRMLARELAGRGQEAVVVTTSAAPEEEGPAVRRVAADWSLKGVRQVVSQLAEQRGRALLFQYVPHLYGRAGVAPGAALFPLMCRSRGLRVITHFHEACVGWSGHPLGFAQAAVHRLQALLLIAGSEGIILSNRRIAGILNWMLRLWARPWAVLASGPTSPRVEVPAERRAAARARWARAGETLVVVYGLASRGKRYDLAVEALDLLCREGRDVRLLMLGDQEAGDRDYCQEVRGEIRSRKLENRVSWSGRLPPGEIQEALACADFMWNLEHGGVTTRNATAAAALGQGLPVVAFRGHGLDSCFRDGENILMVEELSEQALARETGRLLSSPELTERLRMGARRLYDEVFGWPVIVEGYLDLLRRAGVDVG